MFERALIYSRTMQFLRPSQTLGRLYAQLKTPLVQYNLPRIPLDLEVRLKPKISFTGHDPWNRSEDIPENKFTFLNKTKRFRNGQIDWNSEEMPMLWRYNLHYFGYLFLLDSNEKKNICLSWIKNNPVDVSIGWSPYPLSLRITNWCKNKLTDPVILESLYQQASYLYRNFEFYHPGNHLLENARALIFAGLYFEGQGEAEKWLTRGLKLFRQELPVQILGDGGYFERSTMYHALMLECLLDIINIIPDKYPITRYLSDIAIKMCTFLLSLTHPDNKLALFNDSTFEIAPSTGSLISYGRRLLGADFRAGSVFKDSGYYIHRDEEIYLVTDGGPIGPDYLPAHAHGDIFSYELSVNKKRIIVDSGVYEYPEGEMRKYVRSTRAHNTVTVDRKDQAEFWSSFRVARRFKPSDVKFEQSEGMSVFEGRFNGFSNLIGSHISHRRRIECDSVNRMIIVEDYVEGNGEHLVESFIHLSPEVKLQFLDDTIIISTEDESGPQNRKIKITIEQGTYYFEDGWYCPEFYKKIRNNTIVIRENILPARISYRISY